MISFFKEEEEKEDPLNFKTVAVIIDLFDVQVQRADLMSILTWIISIEPQLCLGVTVCRSNNHFF